MAYSRMHQVARFCSGSQHLRPPIVARISCIEHFLTHAAPGSDGQCTGTTAAEEAAGMETVAEEEAAKMKVVAAAEAIIMKAAAAEE